MLYPHNSNLSIYVCMFTGGSAGLATRALENRHPLENP